MKMTDSVRILSISFLIFWAGSVLSEIPNNQELESLLEKGLERGYPGIAMLVRNSEGNVRSAAVGYSDLEKRIPLHIDDAFHMASITKTFTAVATLQLVERGKLSLTDTLSKVLGESVQHIPHANKIAISQLLDHSSGIYPTNNDMAYLETVIGTKADPDRIWTPSELIALAGKKGNEPAGLPAKGHYYSDTNYVLLGMIVEKISGREFKEHIREILLKPLGMQSTYFHSDYLGKSAAPPVQPVQGYLLSTDELRSVIEINPMFQPVPNGKRKEGILLNTTLAAERIDAAGGLVTTLPDLLKFAIALFEGKLLSSENQKFLSSSGENMNQQPVNTERIWTLQAIRKPYGVLLYKEGDGPGGVNTLMAYSPQSKQIFLGFGNIFGYFNEIDFMMDEVISKLVR